MIFTAIRSYHPSGPNSVAGYNQDVMKIHRSAVVVFRLVLVVALLGVPLTNHAAKGPSFEGERIEFALPDLEGRLVSSTDPRFDGRVLLIDLWATYCPPCLTEIPTFVDLQDRMGERGLVVVGIAFEADDDPLQRRSRLREFVEQRGINYLVLDGGNWSSLPDALPGLRDVRGMPVEILVDRESRVVEARNGYGYKKRWARKLEATLTALLDAADGRDP
jgi:thiol-disulfide isomerase/thioredoxin